MIDIPLYMVLPLVAAVMYAYGSLYFKEGFEHGITVIHTFVVTNWVMAGVFVPLLLLEAPNSSLLSHLKPLISALSFVVGNLLTFRAIRSGDMSIVVPVMGTKAFFVALSASVFFGKTITTGMWIAAVLAAIGIYVLGRSDRGKGLSPGVVLTILSSACFGLCDASVQAWAPDYGSKSFMGMTFLFIGLLSIPFLKLADHPLKEADRVGMRALVIGATIIALQGTLVAISVVSFDNATGVNVVYTTRGLWSVILVWWIGHRFRSQEHKQDRKVFLARLSGATVMLAAVAIALWESQE